MFQHLTKSDKELAAYIKGRREERQATESVLNLLRLQGFLNIETCMQILDHLHRIDQRGTKWD